MKRNLACCCAWIVLATVPRTADAQPQHRVVASDSGAVMYELASGVYAILHEPAITTYPGNLVDWPHGNTGVVVGDDGVLVIDSNLFPSRAAADIALIRRVTDRPVRYLLNTHWHGDHTHGNGVYRRTFPGLTIVGARGNDHFIGLNQARFPRFVTAPASPVRQRLAAHQALSTRGVDSGGRALSPEEQQLLRTVIAQLQAQVAEFSAVVVAPPTQLFDSSFVLDLGRRTVELRNWGRANSPADVTAYVPQSRVLFSGDILVHPVPYVFGAYPAPWIGVLRELEKIPVTAIVPGHGRVLPDHAYTKLVRELFTAAATRMDSLLRLGTSQPDAERRLDLTDYRRLFVADSDRTAAAYWNSSIRDGLAERTYQCQVGYRC